MTVHLRGRGISPAHPVTTAYQRRKIRRATAMPAATGPMIINTLAIADDVIATPPHVRMGKLNSEWSIPSRLNSGVRISPNISAAKMPRLMSRRIQISPASQCEYGDTSDEQKSYGNEEKQYFDQDSLSEGVLAPHSGTSVANWIREQGFHLVVPRQYE